MNVFGEGFPEEIINQINVRQNQHYSGYNTSRDVNNQLYKNANTAWCRLVSSTDITNVDKILNTNLKYLPSNLLVNNELAKNFILFNGVSNNNLDNSRSGYGFGDNNYAYTSWGKLNPSVDFGFKPMPGIISAQIKNLNNGSIRTAKVNIKAWDKMSFEIMDVLYFRPGFSILLEWGHSMYYDNDETFISNPNNNDILYSFLEGNISYKTLLNNIKDKRLETHGNYDALYGRVNNFHWRYQPDGSYDITLDITSVGTIVESFKIKGIALTNSSNSTSYIDPNTSSHIEKLLGYNNQNNSIVKYLNDQLNSLLSSGYAPSGITSNWLISGKTRPYVSNNAEVVAMYPFYDSSNINVHYFIRLGDLLNFIQKEVLYRIKNKGNLSQFLYIDTDTDSNLMHAPDTLMSFDPRVCMVRRKIYYPAPINEYKPTTPTSLKNLDNLNGSGWVYDEKSGNMSSQPDATSVGNIVFDPIISAPTNANTNTNATPNQDVKISILEGVSESDEIFANPYADAEYTDTNKISKFMVGSALEDVGKIMNIYINYEFIINKLQELTNVDTNSVDLYTFLKELVSNINGAMGGFPKLDLWIDESTNTLKIIDQNPLPSNSSALTYLNKNINTAKFEISGYHNNNAGFIKNFDFKTEFNPNYANMIAVSAANKGTAVSENNTALSKLNKGLIDKYKVSIDGGGTILNSKTDVVSAKENYLLAKQEYENFLSELEKYLSNLKYNIYNDDEIDSLKGKYTIFMKLYKKYELTRSEYIKANGESTPEIKKSIDSNTKFEPGTGFIPFNLSLTIDGLSGINIKNRFDVNASYLPSNYPDTLDFIIKAVSHEIKDNQWTTIIESYCVGQSNSDNKTKVTNGNKKLQKPKAPVKEKIEEKVDDVKKEIPNTEDIKDVPTSFNFHKIPDQTGSTNNNYRSGQFTEEMLVYVIKTYGIKNIIRFNGNSFSPTATNKKGSNDGTSIGKNKNGVKEWVSIEREAEICESLGCKHYALSSRTDQTKVNKILDEGNTLVHCKWGADRTGGNVGGWIYSKTNKTEADTKRIWDYTVQYNSWDDKVSGGTESQNIFVSDGYLYQAQKFGVRDLDHAIYLEKGIIPPKEPTKIPNIIIGDSLVPFVAKQSTKFKKIGETGGENNLWLGGTGVSWLKEAVKKYPVSNEVKNVILEVGTNGNFKKTDDIKGLFTELKRVFPKAKFYAIQGSWGWGGNKSTTLDQVTEYYKLYKAQGAIIIEPPIGSTSEPHQNLPIYKTIAANIDKLL